MKVHDLALRADYEIASKEHEYFFELDVSFPHTLALSKNLFSFVYTHKKHILWLMAYLTKKKSFSA